VQSKFKDIAAKMGSGCDMMLVTALDDIAWMLNLRGNDITYNPLFFSYVIFHRDTSTGAFRADLFVDQAKVQDADVLQHLASNNISVHNYGDTVAKLQEYSPTGGVKISVDKSQVNLRLWSELKSREYQIEEQDGIIALLKASKNKI